MLDKNRIKEAENNVKSYLNEGLLKKADSSQQVIDILLSNAKESLRVAEEINQKNLSELWVIVCSYYAMYYYANAVLLKFGYKVGDKIVHKVTSDAMIVYIRGRLKETLLEEYEETREEALNLAGIKADALIESFEFERNKRSLIQYRTKEIEKRSKAKTSLQRAKEFTKEMEEIERLKSNKNKDSFCSYCGKPIRKLGGQCMSIHEGRGFADKTVLYFKGVSCVSKTILCSNCAKTCPKCHKTFCPKHLKKHGGVFSRCGTEV